MAAYKVFVFPIAYNTGERLNPRSSIKVGDFTKRHKSLHLPTGHHDTVFYFMFNDLILKRDKQSNYFGVVAGIPQMDSYNWTYVVEAKIITELTGYQVVKKTDTQKVGEKVKNLDQALDILNESKYHPNTNVDFQNGDNLVVVSGRGQPVSGSMFMSPRVTEYYSLPISVASRNAARIVIEESKSRGRTSSARSIPSDMIGEPAIYVFPFTTDVQHEYKVGERYPASELMTRYGSNYIPRDTKEESWRTRHYLMILDPKKIWFFDRTSIKTYECVDDPTGADDEKKVWSFDAWNAKEFREISTEMARGISLDRLYSMMKIDSGVPIFEGDYVLFGSTTKNDVVIGKYEKYENALIKDDRRVSVVVGRPRELMVSKHEIRVPATSSRGRSSGRAASSSASSSSASSGRKTQPHPSETGLTQIQLNQVIRSIVYDDHLKFDGKRKYSLRGSYTEGRKTRTVIFDYPRLYDDLPEDYSLPSNEVESLKVEFSDALKANPQFVDWSESYYRKVIPYILYLQ